VPLTEPAIAQTHSDDGAGADLTDALAVATAATWELAREASAPAARFGRQMLVSAEIPEAAPAFGLPRGVRPVSEVLEGVSDHVNAGVAPLEGSARHAFSFLIGPAIDAVSPREPAGEVAPTSTSPPAPVQTPKRGV
jgi:hypothetical protein